MLIRKWRYQIFWQRSTYEHSESCFRQHIGYGFDIGSNEREYFSPQVVEFVLEHRHYANTPMCSMVWIENLEMPYSVLQLQCML